MIEMMGSLLRRMLGDAGRVGDLSRHRLWTTRYEDLCQ